MNKRSKLSETEEIEMANERGYPTAEALASFPNTFEGAREREAFIERAYRLRKRAEREKKAKAPKSTYVFPTFFPPDELKSSRPW